MNDPLAALKAIHTPEAVGFWPPSLALVLVLLTLAAIIGAVVFFIMRHLRNTRYQKEAFIQLQHIEANAETPKAFVQALSELLRRLAIYHNRETASLTGSHWQQYLQPFFTEDQAHLLAQARYQKVLALSPEEQQSLLTNSQHFIKKVRHV